MRDIVDDLRDGVSVEIGGIEATEEVMHRAAKEIERLRDDRDAMAELCVAVEEWTNGKISDVDLRTQVAIYQRD